MYNSPNSVNFSETIPLSELMRHIRPMVPQVPPPMALDLLRQKYIDFARRTRILASLIVQDQQAGVNDYRLEPPKDYQIYSIIGKQQHSHRADTWGVRFFSELQQDFDVIDNNMIILRSTPSQDEISGMKIWVTLIPKSCISTMPVSIADPFGYDIAKGVVGELLHIPNKEWTNDGLSRRFELSYEKMLLSARSLAASNRKVDSNMAKPIRIL